MASGGGAKVARERGSEAFVCVLGVMGTSRLQCCGRELYSRCVCVGGGNAGNAEAGTYSWAM